MADQPKMNHNTSREEDQGSQSPMQMPSSHVHTRRTVQYVDITAMIRSIQRSEGNIDCFRRGHGECGQLECAWRQYCLGNTKSVFAEDPD